MRRSDRGLVLVLFAACGCGCAVKLDHEFDPTDAADAAPPQDVTTTSGCHPLPGVHGDVRSLALGHALGGGDRDGDVLFLDDDGDGFVASPPLSTACGWSTSALGRIVDVPAIAGISLVAPLDLVATNDGSALFSWYFAADATAPFGLRAIGGGVAMRDAASGTFRAPTSLLWSADRPSYGTSALRVDDYVYAHGCKSSGAFGDAFEDDCYVARAPVDAIASTAAWTYWDGAAWSADVDAAAVIVRAGAPMTVRAIGGRGYVMTYVPPLGRTIELRTAIAPEGPWSAATTLATCDLSGAGASAFCTGGRMHVEIDAGSSIAVTFAAASFDAHEGAPFEPQLVTLALP